MLSDVCAEFVWDIEAAAKKLTELVEHYGHDYPIPYGIEIGGLRKACADVVRDPDDHAAVARLVQLAVATRRAYDVFPSDPRAAELQATMERLSAILSADVGVARAQEITDLIPATAEDTPRAVSAAERLRDVLLPKLGKAAYDICIKVISDIASETIKKMIHLK